MASPFSIFRRNQRLMIAVVGLLAMIAFVFLTPILQYTGDSEREAADEVIVETKYGALRASELNSMATTRQIVRVFLQQVARATAAAAVERNEIDARRQDEAVEFLYLRSERELMGRYHQDEQRATVETMILANKARDLGMVVSDQAINDFLKQITDNSVSGKELAAIIRELKVQDRSVSQGRLFEALRTEMLASRFSSVYAAGLQAIPPAQRFEYFARLNRRATIEYLPIPVSDYLPQVEDPSKDELQEYFAKYRDRLAVPDSPEPGFKQPHRAAFEYFKADYDAIVEQMKVTDEEIQKYYDENKDKFTVSELPDEPEKTKPVSEPELPTSPEGDDSTKGEDSTKGDDSTKGEDPAKPAVPETRAPGEQEKRPERGDIEGDGDFDNFDIKPSEQPAQETEPPAAPKQAARPGSARLILASSQETKQDAPADDTKAVEPSQTPAKPAPAADGESGKADDGSKASASADGKPEADADKPKADDKSAESAEPKYEPLEKVRDTITKEIAREKANARIEDALSKLKEALRRYGSQKVLYEGRKAQDPTLEPPVKPDFAELAKANGLSAYKTGLVSAEEVQHTDLGRSFTVVEDRRSPFGFRRVSFVELAYSDDFSTLRPGEVTRDDENDFYLYWKTKDEPEYVPTLAKVRSQVVRQWKMVKARELALKQARTYVAEARKTKALDKLAVAKKYKVAKAGPFTWMTTGNVPFDPQSNRPQLSTIEGIPLAGHDFMRAVFGLSQGEPGMALDQPQTKLYLVRVLEFSPPLTQLETEFATEDPRRYLPVASDDIRELYVTWLANLEREAGLKWLREPEDGERSTS